jgi:hypothetical protein
MPKVGMHKHVCQKLKGLEILASNVIQSKPLIENRKNERADDKKYNIYQQ